MFPVLLTGASGLVGTALTQRRPMVPLTRSKEVDHLPWWSPTQGVLHDRGQPFESVVQLAGAAVAGRRWNDGWKAQVRDSRVLGTRTIVQWMASLAPEHRPTRLIAASAVGIYGDRGEEPLTEDSPPGTGFLAETCQAWEAEVLKAEALGVKTVRVRVGIVLSTEGGALEKMLPAYRLGGGGPLGSGQQWFPWIHLDDLLGILLRCLDAPSPPPLINAVAPGSCRQADFARTLGEVLHRPAILPVPAFALRAAMGREMADELMFSSQHVVASTTVDDLGHAWVWPQLRPALTDLLRGDKAEP